MESFRDLIDKVEDMPRETLDNILRRARTEIYTLDKAATRPKKAASNKISPMAKAEDENNIREWDILLAKGMIASLKEIFRDDIDKMNSQANEIIKEV